MQEIPFADGTNLAVAEKTGQAQGPELALNGLRDTDYRVIEFVGTPERSECLRKGQCDAVPLGQPEAGAT